MTTIGHHGLLLGAGAAPSASIATNGWSSTTTSTSQTVPFGATASNGMRIIVQFVGRPGTTGTITFPGTWTFMAQQAQGTNQQVTTYYRDCDGTEGTSVVVTIGSSTSVVSAHVYRIAPGVYNAASAPEITSAAAITMTPDPPNITPSWGSATNLIIATFSARSDSVPPASYPLANGQTSTQGSSGGTGGTGNRADIASCWSQQSGTSFDPAAFGTVAPASSRGCIAQTIAIRLP